MSRNVGHPFPQRPRQRRLDALWERGDRDRFLQPDMRCCQRPSRRLEFHRERRTPVSAHRIADLLQRLPGNLLDFVHLRHRTLRLIHRKPRSDLTFERNDRQRVPKQFMQIAREAQPLLGNRRRSKLHLRSMERLVRGNQPHHPIQRRAHSKKLDRDA